jgi:hypothetical protein
MRYKIENPQAAGTGCGFMFIQICLIDLLDQNPGRVTTKTYFTAIFKRISH